MKTTFVLFLMCLSGILITGVTALDNPQGNNPVCQPCMNYGLGFNGPLEYTPYMEPVNDRSYQPGKIYIVYSVVAKGDDWWTEGTGKWQAWGPYEFKAGKGYKVEFGPHDEVGMDEGALPYYVGGTASWLQALNIDFWDENAYAYCVVSEERFRQTSGGHGNQEEVIESDEPVLILDIDTLGGVDNKPTADTYLELSKKTRITKIQTYHWNYGSGSSSPGLIMIIDLNYQHSDGGYDTHQFNAKGVDGMGGVPNAYWVVEPNLVLDPGRYQILDSDSSTWAQNSETGGRGITKVWGVVE